MSALSGFRVSDSFQSNGGTGNTNNSTNTAHYELFHTHRFARNEQWHQRLGLDLDRRDFGDNRSNAPNALQAFAAVAGIEYSPDKQTRFIIGSNPGAYFVHDLRIGTRGAPYVSVVFSAAF